MRDLIDRKTLLKQIDIDSDGEPGYYGDTWKFIDTINNMPSVENDDPEREYLELICEIQRQAIKRGGCHVGSSDQWCIFGADIKAALAALYEKRQRRDTFI